MESVRFIFQWVLATFGGFLLSLLLIEIGDKPDVGVVQGAVGGVTIAFPQAFVLRQRIKNPWLWVLSSLAGWVLIAATGIGAVGWIVPTTQVLALRVFYGAILGAIAGFGIGIAQWLAIRHQVPSMWRWILVSSISWAVSVPVGSAVGMFLHRLTGLFLGEVIGLAVTWLVMAAIAGISASQIFR